MQLSSEAVGAATLVHVGGDIDNFSAPKLREALLAAFASGARLVVVDLTDTQFLDSSALGALVGVEKQQQGGGSELRVACPAPRLRKLFGISHLDEVITVFDSVAAALQP